MAVAAEDRPRGRPVWLDPVALIALHCILIALKYPTLILEPRLWAEEGTVFLQNALFFEGDVRELLHTKGYLNLWNTVTATTAIAFLAPEGWAIWHQLSAFLIQAVVVGYIAMARCAYLGGLVRRAVLVALLSLLVPSAEVMLTTTASQFWAAVPAIVMLFDDAGDKARRRVGADAAFLFGGGLIGPPACILAPAFLLKAWCSRSRIDVVRALALTSAFAIQVLAVKSHQAISAPEQRDFLAAALTTLQFAPIRVTLGSFVAPFAGIGLVDDWARRMSAWPVVWIWSAALALYAAFGVLLWRLRAREEALPLAIGALAVFSFLGAANLSFPVEVTGGLNPVIGQRYTFLVSAVLIMLGARLVGLSDPDRRLGGAVVASAVLAGLLWHSGGDGMPRGPSWKAEIAAWRAGQRDCTVDLAPPGWQLGMGPEFRRRLDQLLQEVPVHDPQIGRPRTTLARLALWRQANGLLWRPGFGQKVFARLCKQ